MAKPQGKQSPQRISSTSLLLVYSPHTMTLYPHQPLLAPAPHSMLMICTCRRTMTTSKLSTTACASSWSAAAASWRRRAPRRAPQQSRWGYGGRGVMTCRGISDLKNNEPPLKAIYSCDMRHRCMLAAGSTQVLPSQPPLPIGNLSQTGLRSTAAPAAWRAVAAGSQGAWADC